ncbi:MAG TPA: hypothetical protein VGP96_06820 [Candidatus Dormibacteraeota bacterium]|nr:hypothetical protein [Candidatus Dormibacteraeota bacterium]
MTSAPRDRDEQILLGELLADLSRDLDVELDSLVPGALRVTRSLVEQGFLLPA